MIHALIFDFDGLILETEEPDYRSWQELYQQYGQDLPLSLWVECIGRDADYFDAMSYLEELIGQQLNREELEARRKRRHRELVESQPVLPGVVTYLQEAQQMGLKLAVASSSRHAWVEGHLARLGLASYWHCIRCRDDVTQAKPDPDLYFSALESLGVAAQEAIAFEDSPNGVLAAKRAGLYCVAIPNPLTADLDLSMADLRLNSLAAMPLQELLDRFDGQHDLKALTKGHRL
jgi:HAD superfamily hydrolase (TIGR01509 family)